MTGAITAVRMAPKVSLFTVHEDTNGGTAIHHFYDDAALDRFAMGWCRDRWDLESWGEMPTDDWRHAYEKVSEGTEWLTVSEAYLDLERLCTVEQAFARAGIQPDSIGALYNAERMAKWEMIDGFETEQHMAALKEWCIRNGAKIEDAMSNAVWKAMPSVEVLDQIAAEMAGDIGASLRAEAA